jgi:transcriptional regulator with XRE-family HTH domain
MIDIGMVLREARENAGLRQREFAARMGMAQCRVSRIENGITPASDEDLERWLHVSRPEDEARVRVWCRTPWEALKGPRPNWDHPELNALSAAADAVKRLRSATVPESMRPSIERYIEELGALTSSLRNLQYRVALIGAPALGQLTLRADGLDLRTATAEQDAEKWDGSTPICEVLFERGDRFGIVIEPESLDEVRRLIEELCYSLLPKFGSRAGERMALQDGVRMALLNMAGLGLAVKTIPAAEAIRVEPLRELAQKEGERLLSSLLLRLRLDERNQTALWWDPGMPEEPLPWLQDNLRKINSGRHDGVPLPRRIRIVISQPVFPGPFSITVSNKRGITDEIVRCPEVAASLSDDRMITVLCLSLLDAPHSYTQSLMEYADEQEFPSWRTRMVPLLLAGPGETSPADLPSRFRSLILDRIHALRADERRRIEAITEAVPQLLDNTRQHAAQTAREEVTGELLLALQSLAALAPDARPHEFLLRQVESAHPCSVWAMTRRRGHWRSLSLDLHLSDGAAELARMASREPMSILTSLLGRYSHRSELREAQVLVQELCLAVEEARRSFIAHVRVTAHATLFSPQQADLRLWASCEAEWYQGPGFRERVLKRLEDWFYRNPACVEDFKERLQSAWTRLFIEPLGRLCSPSLSLAASPAASVDS